jgi:hypothetical protein
MLQFATCATDLFLVERLRPLPMRFQVWTEAQTAERGRPFIVVQVTIGLVALGLLALSRSIAMPIGQGTGFFASWVGGAACLGGAFYVFSRAGLLTGARSRTATRGALTVSQWRLIAAASRSIQTIGVVLVAGTFVFGGVRVPLPGGGTTGTHTPGGYVESLKGRPLQPVTRTRYEQLRTDDLRGALQWLTLAAAVAAVSTSGALRTARRRQ